MAKVTIHTAKTHLSKLIERAKAGEEIIIAKGKEPVVRLVPIERTVTGRRFGALKGDIAVEDSAFEPMTEEEFRTWHGD